MSAKVLDCTLQSPRFEALPLRINQCSPVGPTISMLLLLSPAVLAGLVSMASMGVALADWQTVASIVAERPLASVQIVFAMAIWGALFLVPASLMVARLCKSRTVTITTSGVEIAERSMLRSRTLQIPMQEYAGVAHHIKASLSGLTHELVLVHANPSCDVQLMAGDRVLQSDIEQVKSLLKVPEIPARSIYGRKRTTTASISTWPAASAPASA